MIAGLAVLVLSAGLGALLSIQFLDDTGVVRASSTGLGSDAGRLLTTSAEAPRSETWRSAGETVGASLNFHWPREVMVSQIQWRAPTSWSVKSMLATFSDGSSLLVTADQTTGDARVVFPERSIGSMRLVVATVRNGAGDVALSSLRVGMTSGVPSAGSADDAARGVVGTASSTLGTAEAAALIDGSSTRVDDLGASWSPEPGDRRPWVKLSWPTPRQLTSVQLFGPAGDMAGATSGTLEFSDGSTLVLGAVRGGDAPPTTVGFAPRMVSSVRFTMTGASGGLREFRAFGAGRSPLKAPNTGAPDITAAAASSCTATPAPSTEARELALLCPATGSSVSGLFSVAVAGPGLRDATLSAFKPFPGSTDSNAGSTEVLLRSRTTKAGLVRFAVDGSKLSSGPVTLSVHVAGVDRPLAVQVLNATGRVIESAPPAREGSTLLWQDDFDGPLSASVTGARSTYAASKPELGGPAGFGSAIFADPEWQTDNLGTVDGGYLRLRISPKGDLRQVAKDTRTQLGAIISSSAVGGGGTSAQYGYFEARILGAPGLGTWPAFWALTNPSLVGAKGGGEVDAVELYGHDTASACHAVHSYPGDEAVTRCGDIDSQTDWSMQWHTYGVDIGPATSRFFVDGQLVETLRGPTHTDESYYFLLNLASGGGWPVDLAPTKGIADMYVDWVRVYT